MGDNDSERYCFVVEWYDELAALIRRYHFMYYLKDGSVEMYDIKQGKQFLRRTKAEGVTIDKLYIGSTVDFLSRQINFVDYGDEFTRRKLSSKKERTLGIIKPDAMSKVGPVLDSIFDSGLMVTKLKMCKIGRGEALQFYQEHKGKPFLDKLLSSITEKPIIALELMGESAVSRWSDLLGPTDSSVARQQAPTTLRARFGRDSIDNACHASEDIAAAARELEFFFPTRGQPRQNTAQFSDCTCGVIKPHAVLAGQAGRIISAISEAGFEISMMQMFHLDKANAEEFYEVYKGVVQEYHGMVLELTSGPCIAMEIRAQNAPVAFRDMTGPADPEIARHLRPRTLRALYGIDKIRNAIHCTDLPEDGMLEVEYFFKVLGQ